MQQSGLLIEAKLFLPKSSIFLRYVLSGADAGDIVIGKLRCCPALPVLPHVRVRWKVQVFETPLFAVFGQIGRIDWIDVEEKIIVELVSGAGGADVDQPLPIDVHVVVGVDDLLGGDDPLAFPARRCRNTIVLSGVRGVQPYTARFVVMTKSADSLALAKSR